MFLQFGKVVSAKTPYKISVLLCSYFNLPNVFSKVLGTCASTKVNGFSID